MAAADTAAATGDCGLIHSLAQLFVTSARAKRRLRRAVPEGPWAVVTLLRLTGLLAAPARPRSNSS
jgi:hypothetical protein